MRKEASSADAQSALQFVSGLQSVFVSALTDVAQSCGLSTEFERIEWLRNHGENGGGFRYQAKSGDVFNRASVNVSQIHYAADAGKALLSATALSTIIHPQNPLAPSVHMHISLTELASGACVWRLMADLNPSNPDQADTASFQAVLADVSGQHYASAKQLGDNYFFIPALNKHRGVAHYYMEGFAAKSNEDKALPKAFGEAVIKCYCNILRNKLSAKTPITAEQKQAQLDYHTLYFYQVLTLDKGTTSGLLAHSQNDVGTLGSLPSHINRSLLASWVDKAGEPKNTLVAALLSVIPDENTSAINNDVKARIAEVMRSYYQQHPL